MASIKLRGDTSGELVIEAPAVAGTNTLSLPAATGTLLTTTGDGSQLTGISSYADSDALTLLNASGSAPVYAPRAWLTFNGGTGTDSIIDSGNISSITDNGTGLTTVNFATNLPNANYAVAGITTAYASLGPNENIAFSSAGSSGSQTPTTKTTSAVQVVYGHANTAAKADIAYMCLIFIG